MKTILLAGLGNPGPKYEKTRHNAGFMFVDYFWKKYRDEFGFLDWKVKKSLNAEISAGKINKYKIILLKPQTFMNLSGDAVKKTVSFYKLKLNNLIVAHDDIDFPLGKYKVQSGASSAGHNGAQNIIDQLGTKDFTRIRIGIDNRKNTKIETEKYVLGKFAKNEIKDISKTISDILSEMVENMKIS